MTIKLSDIKAQVAKDMVDESDYTQDTIDEAIEKVLAAKGYTDIATLKADIIAEIVKINTSIASEISPTEKHTHELLNIPVDDNSSKVIQNDNQNTIWNPFDTP